VQLKSDQLPAHLQRSVAPLYAIHGDEPLLSLEAQDAVRAAARRAGCAERVVLSAERGFDWSELAHAADAMSLFSERRLIELRIANGKPGAEGAQALESYCRKLVTENVTLVCLPRLSKGDQAAQWFQSLSDAGVVVNVFPVERARLPSWIAGRLAAQRQQAQPDALDFLAAAVEGNLLAAHQEILKLGLLYPPGALSIEQIRQAVLDVSRYDVYQAAEAMLAGDHRRALRVLDSLRGEGEAAPRIVWVLGEELHVLGLVTRALSTGAPQATVMRDHRVFGEPRQALMARAARRVPSERLIRALRQAARCERMAKGVEEGDVWDHLADLVVML